MRLRYMARINVGRGSFCFSSRWALEFAVFTAAPAPPILEPDSDEVFVPLVLHDVATAFRFEERDADEEK